MEEPSLIARHGAIWVLNKPSGWLTHPSGDPEVPSLQAWARDNLSSTLSPAHRLDRETSGLILWAEDPQVRAEIGRWLAEGQISKTYQALVYGRTHKKGIIRRPLADARRGRKLEAVTRYRAIANPTGRLTLIMARPETGRKHQIRRHLQGIGHPVVGDDRYPPKRRKSVPNFPGRLWLHALRLQLPDGTLFEAPLPVLLQQHLGSITA